MKILVSSEWLNENIHIQDLIILNASQKTNPVKKDTTIENLQIKNARYFNLKENFSDTTSLFPNTLPSVETFEKESRILGINNSSVIVIYDDKGLFFSPRVWWMFKVMGHRKVYVLDGGLTDWKQKGFCWQEFWCTYLMHFWTCDTPCTVYLLSINKNYLIIFFV